MPRQSRTTSGTGVYHVILRGINRQDIFLDIEDYVRMQSCMQQMLELFRAGNRLAPVVQAHRSNLWRHKQAKQNEF